MRILIFGDVIGRAGRGALIDKLPELREKLDVDFVIANGENAAGGFGITVDIANKVFQSGADVITTGNHVWDQREIIGHIGYETRLLRPENFPPGTPGRGHGVFLDRRQRPILVVNLMGRLFMDALDDPFAAADRLLEAHELGREVDAAIIDFHGEASSEKMAMGHYADGRASAVVGTHWHIPTADAQILPGGTAYQTDIGMCGDYDSVIGMAKSIAVARFVKKMPTNRLEPAQGEATLCAVFVETDDRTGLAKRVAPVRTGGRLAPAWPV